MNSNAEITPAIRKEIETTLLMPQQELEEQEWREILNYNYVYFKYIEIASTNSLKKSNPYLSSLDLDIGESTPVSKYLL